MRREVNINTCLLSSSDSRSYMQLCSLANQAPSGWVEHSPAQGVERHVGGLLAGDEHGAEGGAHAGRACKEAGCSTE